MSFSKSSEFTVSQEGRCRAGLEKFPGVIFSIWTIKVVFSSIHICSRTWLHTF